MAKEVTILVPDYKPNERIDINVVSGGKEVVKYRLEVVVFDEQQQDLSRFSFVQDIINNYDKNYSLVEVGNDSGSKIPLLFRDNNTSLV